MDDDEKFLPAVLSNDLYSSISSSPQPNALIRTALFTPKARKKVNAIEHLDVTDAFSEIEYFGKEGYDTATIHGVRLNVQTDFKIWCGIVFAFSKYGINSNKVTLKFTEFAKLCGYKSNRFNKPLRDQIDKSLDRLQSQKIRLKTKNTMKSVSTGLLLKAEFDIKADTITLLGDENLWELYSLDYQVLISMSVLAKLPNSEAAQCLYLFFASLPQDPWPVNFERMRKRLQLNMATKEINRSIKNAIKKLEDTGYLTGTWVTFHNKTAYKITSRNKSKAISN